MQPTIRVIIECFPKHCIFLNVFLFVLCLQAAILPEMLHTLTDMQNPGTARPRRCLWHWCWWETAQGVTILQFALHRNPTAKAFMTAVLTMSLTQPFLLCLRNSRSILSTSLNTLNLYSKGLLTYFLKVLLHRRFLLTSLNITKIYNSWAYSFK